MPAFPPLRQKCHCLVLLNCHGRLSNCRAVTRGKQFSLLYFTAGFHSHIILPGHSFGILLGSMYPKMGVAKYFSQQYSMKVLLSQATMLSSSHLLPEASHVEKDKKQLA